SSKLSIFQISDLIRGDDASPSGKFHSLFIALLFPNAVCAASILFYGLGSATIVRDLKIVADELEETARQKALKAKVNDGFDDISLSSN
ncbi:unnamed protein product, partial [Mesorhabditis spiculigera]